MGAGRGVPVTTEMSIGNLGLLVFAGSSIHRRAFAASRAVVAVTQVQASGVLRGSKVMALCRMFSYFPIIQLAINQRKVDCIIARNHGGGLRVILSVLV